MSNLLIGWSETDTTPEGKIDLYGQYYHRFSEGIHLRLSATVLALESQSGEQAVMVSMDIAGFEKDFQDQLRAMLIPELPELNVSKVFLNATHTHNSASADLTTGTGWLKELPEVLPRAQYRKFLLEKIRDAVIAAWHSRKPGGVVNALSFARVGHCRRTVYSDGTAEMYGSTNREDFIGMESGEDSRVDLLFTFDESSKPTGVILNLACPSQIMEATYLISSDFMGEVRQLLKKRFGENFRTLGQISAAGCQSPRYLIGDNPGEPDFWHADGVKEIGQRLQKAIETVFPQITANINFSPVMRHMIKQISLPHRRVSHNDFIDAQIKLKNLESIMSEEDAYRQFCEEVCRNEKIPGRPGPYDNKFHHFVLIQNSKAVIARYNSQDKNSEFKMELHSLRLGNTVFVTNPFELHLDFGHQIKARSIAEQTFIVELCGGTGGYLSSARAEQLGGYGGLVINGNVGSDGGKKLVDMTVKSIAELWE